MSNLQAETHEQGIALTRDWVKQQLWNSIAMLLSAIMAYFFVESMPIVVDGLAFSTAAAVGFTVGVCCSPSSYRTRNGSLAMAFSLMVFMWTIPILFLVAAL